MFGVPVQASVDIDGRRIGLQYARRSDAVDCSRLQQDGQCQVRRSHCVVKDSVDSNGGVRFCTKGAARIQVRVVAREVTAGRVYPQPVAGLEYLCGGPQVNLELVHLTWRQQLRLRQRFAVARA